MNRIQNGERIANEMVDHLFEMGDLAHEVAMLCGKHPDMSLVTYETVRKRLEKEVGAGAFDAFALIQFGLVSFNYFRSMVNEPEMEEIQESLPDIVNELAMRLAPSQGTG